MNGMHCHRVSHSLSIMNMQKAASMAIALMNKGVRSEVEGEFRVWNLPVELWCLVVAFWFSGSPPPSQ